MKSANIIAVNWLNQFPFISLWAHAVNAVGVKLQFKKNTQVYLLNQKPDPPTVCLFVQALPHICYF